MERDEESGLEYHSARYYLPWLARWLSKDPLETKYHNSSVYMAFANNPIIYIDINGKEIRLGFFDPRAKKAYEDVVNKELGGMYKIKFTHVKDQMLSLIKDKVVLVLKNPKAKLTTEQTAFVQEYKQVVNSTDVVRQVLVYDDPAVTTGSFEDQQMDMKDILRYDQAGATGMTSAGALIHETVEEHEKAKQGLSLVPLLPNRSDSTSVFNAKLANFWTKFNADHSIAILAENKVNGNIRRDDLFYKDPSGNGVVITMESNGEETYTTVGPNTVSKQIISASVVTAFKNMLW